MELIKIDSVSVLDVQIYLIAKGVSMDLIKEVLNDGVYLAIPSHTGKMQYMQSLNTSCKANNTCMKYHLQFKNSTCEHCYAQNMQELYKGMKLRYLINSFILSQALSVSDLKRIALYFSLFTIARLEAFGDILNEIHLHNLVSICKYAKKTRFTLWTKNYKVLLEYFRKGFKFSKNMNLLLSSLYLNKVIKPGFVDIVKRYHKNTSTFTVYTAKYAIENNININCGGKQCYTCQSCYRDSIEGVTMNECLKSDFKKYEKMKKAL